MYIVVIKMQYLFFLHIDGPVNVKHFRIPGVLQRLAVSYGVVALLEAAFAKAGDPHRVKNTMFIFTFIYLCYEQGTSCWFA